MPLVAVIKEALWAALAALVLMLGLGVTSFAVFPIGGGEYHAIFAYTDEGRFGSALIAYASYLTSVSGIAALLVWRRYPVRWWVVAALAVVVGLRAWWGICSWQPQAPGFHKAVIALVPGFPVVSFGVCWLLARRSGRINIRSAA